MNIHEFSSIYTCRHLNESDLEVIYNLCINNKLYYHHCPPMISYELIKEDMYGLPKGKELKDKYYVGLFDNDQLICIIDLIDGYPTADCAYIGLFMLDIAYQGKGIGTSIMNDLTQYLVRQNFKEVQLGFVKTNPQASHFWNKLGFTQCKDEVDFDEYIVVPVNKKIQ